MPTENTFVVGQRVSISADGDGAEGAIGVVGRIYRSGRCRVDLSCGGFRNLPPECLTVVTKQEDDSEAVGENGSSF